MAEEPTTSSTNASPSGPPPEQTVNVPGLVGLLLAVMGLMGGFCIQPVALLGTLGMGVSIVGLFRVPRTLAIAGVVIGLVATLFGLVPLLTEAPGPPEGLPEAP